MKILKYLSSLIRNHRLLHYFYFTFTSIMIKFGFINSWILLIVSYVGQQSLLNTHICVKKGAIYYYSTIG